MSSIVRKFIVVSLAIIALSVIVHSASEASTKKNVVVKSTSKAKLLKSKKFKRKFYFLSRYNRSYDNSLFNGTDRSPPEPRSPIGPRDSGGRTISSLVCPGLKIACFQSNYQNCGYVTNQSFGAQPCLGTFMTGECCSGTAICGRGGSSVATCT